MNKLLRTAFILSLITIFYNIIEGLISVYFGAGDETLALFGFGADSFVEVISGIGIAHMIFRMKYSNTIPGIVIAVISIATMYWLMTSKLNIGKALNSDAIIADANCTKTCFYLSFILLASSGLYEVFHIAYFDIIGSLGIAYFAFNEGREAFEKVRSGNLACNCEDDCETEIVKG
ncbi:MAG: hypothetical protein P8X73_02175 [Ignavibacteriaceae bacterium]